MAGGCARLGWTVGVRAGVAKGSFSLGSLLKTYVWRWKVLGCVRKSAVMDGACDGCTGAGMNRAQCVDLSEDVMGCPDPAELTSAYKEMYVKIRGEVERLSIPRE